MTASEQIKNVLVDYILTHLAERRCDSLHSERHNKGENCQGFSLKSFREDLNSWCTDCTLMLNYSGSPGLCDHQQVGAGVGKFPAVLSKATLKI